MPRIPLRLQVLAATLLAVAAGLWLVAPSLDGYLLSDDLLLPGALRGAGPDRLGVDWSRVAADWYGPWLGFDNAFWRPLLSLTFGIDLARAAGGTAAVELHQTNVAIHLLTVATALHRILPANGFDQNPPHRLGRSGKEVSPAVPVLSLLDVHQTQIRLVDQTGRLQRVVCRFISHPCFGQPSQLVIHQRQQLIGSSRIGSACAVSVRHWPASGCSSWLCRCCRMRSPDSRPRMARRW